MSNKQKQNPNFLEDLETLLCEIDFLLGKARLCNDKGVGTVELRTALSILNEEMEILYSKLRNTQRRLNSLHTTSLPDHLVIQ